MSVTLNERRLLPWMLATILPGWTNTCALTTADCALPNELTDKVNWYIVSGINENAGRRYLLGSFDVDEAVSTGMLFEDRVHLYDSPAELLLPPHIVMNAELDTNNELFRSTVRRAGPGREILGRVSFNTSTCLLPTLHWPKKLHTRILKLYV